MQNSSQIITTNKPTTSNVLQTGCPSCRLTNGVTAPKGKLTPFHNGKNYAGKFLVPDHHADHRQHLITCCTSHIKLLKKKFHLLTTFSHIPPTQKHTETQDENITPPFLVKVPTRFIQTSQVLFHILPRISVVFSTSFQDLVVYDML